MVHGFGAWCSGHPGTTFEYLGEGQCVDADGKQPNRHWKQSGASADTCRDACRANTGCTGLSYDNGRYNNGQCLNFGNALTNRNKPEEGHGWAYLIGNYGGSDAITKTNGYSGFICERKTVVPIAGKC